MMAKPPEHVRILSAQLNTFPKSNRTEDCAKMQMIHALMVNSQANIVITQEDNTDWRNTTASKRPKERCSSWFESLNVHSAYNINEENERRQRLQGGVSTWSINDATHRIESRGVDNTSLGRWNYIRYQGRNGLATQVYSIYRPCKSDGTRSVYSQQVRHLSSIQDARCPQVAMVEDLKKELEQARDDGDQLIIGGDFNLDLRSEAWSDFTADLELENAIFR